MPTTRQTVRTDDLQLLADAALDALWQFVGIADASLMTADADVTVAQFRVLATIARHGPVGVATLAKLVGVAPSTATRMCDRLVRAHLLERNASELDRRVVAVSLTPRGAQLVKRVTAWRRRALNRAFASIDPDRQAAVAEALAECAAALAESTQPQP
jgi:DNA-binding MarR family transcriptional regulator